MMGVNTDQNVIVIVMVAKASPGISARRRLLPRTRATPNRDAENPSAANRYFKHRQTKTATATKTPPPLLFGRAPKKKTHTHSRSTKRSKRSRGRSFRSSPFLLLRPLCSLSLSLSLSLSPRRAGLPGGSRAGCGTDGGKRYSPRRPGPPRRRARPLLPPTPPPAPPPLPCQQQLQMRPSAMTPGTTGVAATVTVAGAPW